MDIVKASLPDSILSSRGILALLFVETMADTEYNSLTDGLFHCADAKN